MKIKIELTLEKNQAETLLELMEVNMISLGQQIEMLAPALNTTIDENKRDNIKDYMNRTAAQHMLCAEIYDTLIKAGTSAEEKSEVITSISEFQRYQIDKNLNK